MVRCGWFGKRQGLVVSSGSVMLWWLDERGEKWREVAVACSEDEMKEVNDAGEIKSKALKHDIIKPNKSTTTKLVEIKRRGVEAAAGAFVRPWWPNFGRTGGSGGLRCWRRCSAYGEDEGDEERGRGKCLEQMRAATDVACENEGEKSEGATVGR
ncbi:hypothetical protein HAX54_041210 [Datura stramonium]|uniref:Uncharacterized protein n=1 Tax=Datura stramonium TaxID=4076 RepID=A0ABS8VS54_DATST|nr:hypothetical protein [Datura stramonium]